MRLLVFFLLLLPCVGFGQTTYVQTFQRTIVGPQQLETATDIEELGNGNYMIAGFSASWPNGGNYDVFLHEIDTLGNHVNMNTFGVNNYDNCYAMDRTPEKGFITAGLSVSWQPSGDMYVVKTDSLGDKIWAYSYGGPMQDFANDVKQTSDGNFILAGQTMSYGSGGADVYVVKIDSAGDTLWTRTLGGPGPDGASAIIQASDGNYVLAGYFTNATYEHIYAAKLDQNGDTLWTTIVEVLDGDGAYDIVETSDGGYVLTGYLWTEATTFSDIFLLKLNTTGQVQWMKSYSSALDEYGVSVKETHDSGLVVLGTLDTIPDEIVIRTNASGDTLWTRTYGGYEIEHPQAIIQTKDKGFLFCGYSRSFGDSAAAEAYYIKTDPSGKSYCNENNHSVIVMNPAYNIYQGGQMGAGGEIIDAWTTFQYFANPTEKLLCDSSYVVVSTPTLNHRQADLIIYPNPTTGIARITNGEQARLPDGQGITNIQVFDLFGRPVPFEFDIGRSLLDIRSSPPGVYFVKMGEAVRKLVVQ